MHTIIPTMLLSLCFFSFLHCAKTPEPFLRLYPQKATNLHIAIAENNLYFIRRVIRNGTANPLTPDENGITPLDLLDPAKHPMTTRLLLSSPRLKTFIQEAASKGRIRIIATVFSLLDTFPDKNCPLQSNLGQDYGPLEYYNREDRYCAYCQTKVNTKAYTL